MPFSSKKNEKSCPLIIGEGQVFNSVLSWSLLLNETYPRTIAKVMFKPRVQNKYSLN